ncbi:CvpA family protein [Pseudokineococcus basanitobsidens]|uniref:CvpA family protein n=1 Tax=Pseudokineococcus basanitobsidens TaxID=1926649 RepID=A0ABU8RFI2_9ACTN
MGQLSPTGTSVQELLSRATVVDLVALVVVVLAALGGWRSGGGTVLGRLVGGGAGLVLGLRAPAVVGPLLPSVEPGWVVPVGCLVVGVLLGLALGGAVGGLVSGLLARLHVGVLDRLLGALASGAVAALVCVGLVSAAAAWGGPSLRGYVTDGVVASAGTDLLGDLPSGSGAGHQLADRAGDVLPGAPAGR